MRYDYARQHPDRGTCSGGGGKVAVETWTAVALAGDGWLVDLASCLVPSPRHDVRLFTTHIFCQHVGGRWLAYPT